MRQIEKAFTNLTFFYISAENLNAIPGPFISFLAVIKVAIPQIFSNMKNVHLVEEFRDGNALIRQNDINKNT